MTRFPWRPVADGVVLAVRLTPKASRDQVKGIEPGPEGARLAVAVRAIPDKGEANAALLEVLADWMRLPKSRLSLAGGGKSRLKAVKIDGQAQGLIQLLADKLIDME